MVLYKVNEIFRSIQGEGVSTGRVTTFIRLAGCSMGCPFCDTSYAAYSLMSIPEILLAAAAAAAAGACDNDDVVLTGGEPLEQDVSELLFELDKFFSHVTIETNGTRPLPERMPGMVDISLSPKVPLHLIELSWCTSLKVLFPYIAPAITAERFTDFQAEEYFIQPLSGANREAYEEVMRLGAPWRLGLQVHKLIQGVR